MKAVKVGTQLDPRILRDAKVFAARRRKRLREVFEEALRAYLRRNGEPEDIGTIDDAWGWLKLSRRDFTKLLQLPLHYEIE